MGAAELLQANLNRRMESRHEVRWYARWSDSYGREHLGEIYDISSKGVFMRPSSLGPHMLLTAGTRIRVQFTTPEGQTIQAQGTMRWAGMHRQYGCKGFGIEFDEQNVELTDYLRSELQMVV